MGKYLRDYLKRIVGTIRGNTGHDNITLWSQEDLHCGPTQIYIVGARAFIKYIVATHEFTLWSLVRFYIVVARKFTLWSPTKYGYVFFAPKK